MDRLKVEVATGQVLQQLLDAGRIDTSKLTPGERAEYIKRVASLVGLAVATMPCCQEAMALAHPNTRTEQRYILMVEGIMLLFGLAASDVPADPTSN